MNSFRKSFIFIISLFMLIVQITLAQDALSGLDGLGDPNQPQCVVPIPFLDGQVWRASGTNGGLSVTNPGGAIDPITYGINQFAGLISGNNVEPIAILVVDSFGLVDNWTQFMTGLVAGQYPDDAALADSFESGIPAHGQLVLNHIFGLLRGAGYVSDGSGFAWSSPNSMIYVYGVDINYTSGTEVLAEDISKAIIQAINTLKGNQEITRFVVNESFAVIPCIVATHKASVDFDDLSFEEYLAEVAGLSIPPIGSPKVTGTREEDIAAAVLHRFDLVENGEYCGGNFLSDVQVQFVASSGNSGLDFPFAPAAWPEVMGVTASEGINHPGGYANWVEPGEIKSIPGGWYQLAIPNLDPAADPAPLNDTSFLDVYYRGTSFSAPTYAVQAAIDMSAGQVYNAVSPCSGEPAKSE